MKSQYRQKFFELYSREILPLFVDHEKKRQSKKNQLFMFLIILSGVLCICLYNFIVYSQGANNQKVFCLVNSEFGMIILMLALIGSIIGLCILPGWYNKDFKKELKQICEPAFAKCFKNLEWDKSGYFGSEILERSQLFGYFNRESYDDIFTITHEGVKINVIEADLEDVQGSGKNRRTYKIFKGVIIIFPSNKTIKAHTTIASKGDFQTGNIRTGAKYTTLAMLLLTIFFLFFNDLGSAVAYGIGFLISLVVYRTSKQKKMEDIKLEDVEFDKKFQVVSEDQLEARYLITPAFMDRLKNLQTGFGTKNIKCAFFEDKIMFAISSNEDLFEVGSLFVPLNNSKQMTKFFNELTSILEMVDHFKLDQKTGL